MRFLCVFFLFSSLLMSCSDSPSGQANENSDSAVDTISKKTNSDRIEDLKSTPELSEVENRSSAARLTETYEKTKVWGILLRMSKWGKQVHNGNYIVMAPSNNTLKEIGLDVIAELKYAENKELLDVLMAKHIISTPMNVTKMQAWTEAETIDGGKIKVDAIHGMIGGLRYEVPEVQPERGGLVVVYGVIDLPEAKLQALKNKRNS